MKRPSALPIWVQVATLAVFAVVMSQAVAFGVVVLSPEPKPTGFTVEQAAAALRGEPAETSDGRPLKRRLTSALPMFDKGQSNPPEREVGVLSNMIRDGLVEQLQVSKDRVQVRSSPPESRITLTGNASNMMVLRSSPVRPGRPQTHTIQSAERPSAASQNLPIVLQGALNRAQGPDAPRRIERVTILSNNLTFPPFSAALKLDDGRWAVVEPPRGWLAPWQKRLLLGFGISMLLLAPLVWWMGRRLTRPIRVFADAAARLGADPEAAPLPATGPSEVRTAITAFNDMQGSLRDHVRKRTQTVAAIAHDLRTPLTRLRFRAEQAPDPVRDRMAADIEEMDALIGQAMAYVRGETPSERRERFDLADLAADCVQGFSETGTDVTFIRDAYLPVDGDPAALRRALTNLIGNAVKFAGAARVTAERVEQAPVIRIEDDGPGLPDAELEAVFDPFHRGEASRNRETGGAGLGLTVARQAARAHGGDVIVRNRSGGGLEALLRLDSTATNNA
ncbi:ATP-binding protein [Brevundimonas sp. NPDC092305]|uniref:ATP-binding protein n=1 Tax=Brevundimonas sp. NPDC092305 TaxID=3363957 RepID=UPI003803C119